MASCATSQCLNVASTTRIKIMNFSSPFGFSRWKPTLSCFTTITDHIRRVIVCWNWCEKKTSQGGKHSFCRRLWWTCSDIFDKFVHYCSHHSLFQYSQITKTQTAVVVVSISDTPIGMLGCCNLSTIWNCVIDLRLRNDKQKCFLWIERTDCFSTCSCGR